MKSFASLHNSRAPLFEYSLIVHPCGEILGKIEKDVEGFLKGSKMVTHAPKPHIAIAKFLAMESMEETLIRWMRRICSEQESFCVTLNNYSGVPPGTIYLRIQNATPFEQFGNGLKAINAYIGSCACPALQLVTTPRLRVVNLVPGEIYTKALAAFSKRSFHASFEVNELLLMKRENAFEPSKKVTVFGLPPLKADYN